MQAGENIIFGKVERCEIFVGGVRPWVSAVLQQKLDGLEVTLAGSPVERSEAA